MNIVKYLEILGKAFELGNTDELSKVLHNNCTYHSDYSAKTFNSALHILENISNVYSNLNDDSKYSYKIIKTNDIRLKKSIFKNSSDKSMLLYQYGDCVTSVVTIKTNRQSLITHIELSRDRDLYDVEFYDDSVEPDSANDIPQIVFNESSDNSTYIWNNAHSFIKKFLYDNDYIIYKSQAFDDCIGYQCNRYGNAYTVFMFAFGQKQTIPMAGDFCSKLATYNFSKNSTILVVYLNVQKKKKGKYYEYNTYTYSGQSGNIELWELKSINEKYILSFYPRKELEDRTNELICAYNNDSLDIYDMIIADINPRFEQETGVFLNDGFFSCIKCFHKEHGDMKTGYIRFNDVVYSRVPYIKDLGYFDFSVNPNNHDKITTLRFTRFDDNKRNIKEFIEFDTDKLDTQLETVPKIIGIELPAANESERFTLKLDFSNGEKRKFHLPVSLEDNVIKYKHYVFTDKIWGSAHISNNRLKPQALGYDNYPDCGQGIDFINGYSISNLRCYYESVPYFDDKITEIDIHSMQKFNIEKYDYENGYSVSYVSEFSSLCLINKNKMIIKKLPQEYQQTPIYVYPHCGGLYNGLIMVSSLGDIELKYHHNLRGCAGIWGWLDINFNTVIEPKYIFAQHFYGENALVCKGDWTINEEGEYWCDEEKWGVIDKNENEIAPFIFDELSLIDDTDRYIFGHANGWDNGYYCVFDIEASEIILQLDFEFDIYYMFNSCFYINNHIIFTEHIPGEEIDYIYSYGLISKEWELYHVKYEGRTLNGDTKIIVNKDGKDIIVF